MAYVAYVGGRALQRTSSTSSARIAGLGGTTDVAAESFRERVVAPMGRRIGGLGMRLTPHAWSDRARRRLVRAGWYPDIDETAWAAIKVVTFLGCALLFAVIAMFLEGAAQWLAFFILAVIGTVGPDQLLKRRVDERVHAIERDLPDMIDLMVISIEAGLGFDSALDRVVRHVPGELSDEFTRMVQETRVGVSRSEAMRNLAKRTDVDDLNSFVLALNQADTFGVSIGRMLRVQADEMRVRRRQRAQEKAFAAPVKMVFPLVLCVFPALFVVLLGPAAINIANNLLSG